MIKKFRKLRVSFIAISIAMCTVLSTPTSALAMSSNDEWKNKIDADLTEKMNNAGKDEIIKVWLWLKDQDDIALRKMVKNETGMDPDVYEDENRFNLKIAPEITKQIEEAVGYEKAHKKDVPTAESKDVSTAVSQDVSATESKDVSATESQDVSAAESKDVSAAESKDVSATESQDASVTESQDVSATESQDVSATESKDVSATESKDASATESKDASATESKDASATESKDVSAAKDNLNMEDTAKSELSNDSINTTSNWVTEFINKSTKEDNMDHTISLVDRAIGAKHDEYLAAKKNIIRREYSAVNDEFVSKNIPEGRLISYNSRYTSTLIVEATRDEIIGYAKDDVVKKISLYVEAYAVPLLNITLDQVNADTLKSSSYNNGWGYKGTGINIGIMEPGVCSTTGPMLNGLRKANRLTIVPNTNGSGRTITATAIDHTSLVASIIAGQSVSFGGNTYEGIVPNATVFSTMVSDLESILHGVNTLVDANHDVDVINMSFGVVNHDAYGQTVPSANEYTNWDQELDRLIINTGVTIVAAAGNNSTASDGGTATGDSTNNLTSPARALNCISVGNANTKSAINTTRSPRYDVHLSSSWEEPNFIPSKPDLCAPGTLVAAVRSQTSTTENFYLQNEPFGPTGTSFAAPHVTGVIAQLLEAQPGRKGQPNAIKAKIIYGANADLMVGASATNNYESSLQTAHTALLERTGAGMLDADGTLSGDYRTYYAWNFSGTSNYETIYSNINYTSGQRVRAVLAYNYKPNAGDNLINGTNQYYNMDIRIINAKTGAVLQAAEFDRNNIEILDYTFSGSGQFNIQVRRTFAVSNRTVDWTCEWAFK